MRAVLNVLRIVVVFEIRMWRSLYRWIFRRPVATGPGAEPFTYAGLQTPLLVVFIAVSAIEIPVLHMLLPWEAVRFVVDLLGVYGLLWMIGILAMVRVHPHVLSDEGLRFRYAAGVDATLPWSAVAAVRERGRGLEKGRSIQVIDGVLHVVMVKQTNVDVTLREPTTVTWAKGRSATVTEVRLYADDPRAFVARARELADSRKLPPASDYGAAVSMK